MLNLYYICTIDGELHYICITSHYINLYVYFHSCIRLYAFHCQILDEFVRIHCSRLLCFMTLLYYIFKIVFISYGTLQYYTIKFDFVIFHYYVILYVIQFHDGFALFLCFRTTL